MALKARTRYHGGWQFPAHLRFKPTQPERQTQAVALDFPAGIVAFSSGKDRCGINEYSRGLSAQMRLTGLDVSDQLLSNTALLQSAPAGAKLLIHVEPSLLPREFDDALASARKRGAKIVCCFHYFDTQMLRRFEKLADRLVVHREYGHRHEKLRQVPLGCPVFAEPDTRALKTKFAFDGPVVTTLGFLSAWKRVPDLAASLLPELKKRGATFQILCPSHFSGDGGEAARLRSVLYRDSTAVWISEFIPELEMLERVAASDLGVAFHGMDTGSVSAANRMFVAGRCPLVLTRSTHDSDIRSADRTASLDLGTYVDRVLQVLDNAEKRASMRDLIRHEYGLINQAVVAKQYVRLFEELS